MRLTSEKIEVLSDLFTNLAAGFFATLIIFPGFLGIRTIPDILVLLFINLPSAILSLLIAFRLKEYHHA